MDQVHIVHPNDCNKFNSTRARGQKGGLVIAKLIFFPPLEEPLNNIRSGALLTHAVVNSEPGGKRFQYVIPISFRGPLFIADQSIHVWVQNASGVGYVKSNILEPRVGTDSAAAILRLVSAITLEWQGILPQLTPLNLSVHDSAWSPSLKADPTLTKRLRDNRDSSDLVGCGVYIRIEGKPIGEQGSGPITAAPSLPSSKPHTHGWGDRHGGG